MTLGGGHGALRIATGLGVIRPPRGRRAQDRRSRHAHRRLRTWGWLRQRFVSNLARSAIGPVGRSMGV